MVSEQTIRREVVQIALSSLFISTRDPLGSSLNTNRQTPSFFLHTTKRALETTSTEYAEDLFDTLTISALTRQNNFPKAEGTELMLLMLKKRVQYVRSRYSITIRIIRSRKFVVLQGY